MPNKITHTQVYVLDQDKALDFYVGKLGFELNTDADLGFMRWLTVNFPGQPDHQLLLEKPGPPAHDDTTAEQIRELVTKGAMGMAAIISVDDIQQTYKELLAKGVEFTDEPTERFYGTDCGLRDMEVDRTRRSPRSSPNCSPSPNSPTHDGAPEPVTGCGSARPACASRPASGAREIARHDDGRAVARPP